MSGLQRRGWIRPVSPGREDAARRAGSTFTNPRTGLQAGTGLQRREGIRPVSAKRGRQNRERAAMVADLFPERPLCVVYELSQHHPGVIPDEVISRCGRWADDVHEPLTRARGGSITDPGNAVPPCRQCHDALGREPGWGYELGLLRHSWDGRGVA